MIVEPKTAWVDHIPVIWLEPQYPKFNRRLIIFLSGLSGSKESVLPYLTDLAQAGFVALSFDNWEHGERMTLTQQQVAERTFRNFRRYMWVNIAQTALDTLRVIDWAVDNLHVAPEICMGGLSMGGDIAVTAAGIDHRIRRVAAVVATPDWQRPGMVGLFDENRSPLPTGNPDAYSQKLYDLFNPITHLEHYNHAPQIRFINGEKDDHVPPEASFRFKSALASVSPLAAENIIIDLLPGLDHIGVGSAADQWWPGIVGWLSQPMDKK